MPVTHAQRVASEEIFGPVLSVMTFPMPDEAFERANNFPYGLSAGVRTDKGSFRHLTSGPPHEPAEGSRRREEADSMTTRRVRLLTSAATVPGFKARTFLSENSLPVRGGEGEVFKLRAGVVWANTYNKFDPTSPFGGYKESGFGREGGLQGLAAYCRLD